jgi:hypothetical protein
VHPVHNTHNRQVKVLEIDVFYRRQRLTADKIYIGAIPSNPSKHGHFRASATHSQPAFSLKTGFETFPTGIETHRICTWVEVAEQAAKC